MSDRFLPFIDWTIGVSMGYIYDRDGSLIEGLHMLMHELYRYEADQTSLSTQGPIMTLSSLSNALGNDPHLMLAALLGLAGMLTLLTLVLGLNAIARYHAFCESERRREFIQEMTASGYSADEVERLLSATTPVRPKRTHSSRHSIASRTKMTSALSHV